MKNSILVKTALITAVIPLFAGCVTREVVYQPAPPNGPPPQAEVVDTPPPAQVEVIPAQPDPSFVWIAGYYDYGPRGWVWFPGRWAPRPHPGAIWIRGGWVYRGHHRVWVAAHWR